MKHFGPMQVSIYADGYTRISGTSCGKSEVDIENDIELFDHVTFHPLEVTCKRCLYSKIYRNERTKYDQTGIPKIPTKLDLIPHMRNSVAKSGGKFDVHQTLRLRRFLGISEKMPDIEQRKTIMAAELAKQEKYAAMRIARLEDALNEARETQSRIRNKRIP